MLVFQNLQQEARNITQSRQGSFSDWNFSAMVLPGGSALPNQFPTPAGSRCGNRDLLLPIVFISRGTFSREGDRRSWLTLRAAQAFVGVRRLLDLRLSALC